MTSEQTQPTAKLDDAAFMGYLMAAVCPVVGVLVGCALIARGEEHGASVVGWSVLSAFVWAVLLTFGWLLFVSALLA